MDKVLVVDDDQILLKKLKEGLQKYKGQFEVVTASDGKEALEVLKKERISVLITDMVMPKMDGLELLAHMRKNRPQVPCIVIAEPESFEIKKIAGRQEIFRYLEKPFEFNQLADVIMEGLDHLDEGLFWRGHHK